jgi:hypothetical protein
VLIQQNGKELFASLKLLILQMAEAETWRQISILLESGKMGTCVLVKNESHAIPGF